MLFICGELEQYDVSNLKDYMKIIIRHITNGNTIEERLVSAMGGNIIVTEADKIRAAGHSEGLSEGRAEGLSGRHSYIVKSSSDSKT